MSKRLKIRMDTIFQEERTWQSASVFYLILEIFIRYTGKISLPASRQYIILSIRKSQTGAVAHLRSGV